MKASAGGRRKRGWDAAPPLRLLAWEVTRSCNLNCRHCRAAARRGPYTGELDTGECRRVLESLPPLGEPIVILTGGEPMLREDIYELARYGTDLGLRMVMAPCGLMLTEESCRRLIDSGIRRISLSVDGADAASHDAFRGMEGAFEGVMRGMRAAKKAGLEFQVNTTVTKHNVADLPAIFDLALRMGAVSFHPFLLVPTGRGGELADQQLPPSEYERVLHWIYEQRGAEGMRVKPTCAPHYYRILRQRERAEGRAVKPGTHGLDAMTKGCLGGQGFAFLSHVGTAQICGFLDVPAGDIRDVDYDFGRIWKESKLYAAVRNVDGYGGRCGICEYRKVCGGCRARAYATSGDYLAEEPFCTYQPRGRGRD